MRQATTPTSRYDGAESQQFSNWTSMVEGKFRTGLFRHELVAGLSWQEADRPLQHQLGLHAAGQRQHLRPVQPACTTARPASHKYRAGDTEQKAAFVSDTMCLTEKWSVLGGLRVTNYEQNGYGSPGTTGGNTNFTKNGLITPTAAIMFKPMPKHHAVRQLRGVVRRRRHRLVVLLQRRRRADAGQEPPVRSGRQDGPGPLDRYGSAVPHRATHGIRAATAAARCRCSSRTASRSTRVWSWPAARGSARGGKWAAARCTWTATTTRAS